MIDDEPRAHVILKNYISRINRVELAGIFDNAIDAYEYLKKTRIDLVLLDINMPEIDGFSFLEMLDSKPMIIFTTAHTEYAFRGYELNAIDYLHKPVRFERFVKAIDKACAWKLVETAQQKVRMLEIKVDGRPQQYNIEDIIYMEGMGNYVKLYFRNRMIMTYTTLKELEAKLAGSSMVRIHKSYLVNIAAGLEIHNDSISVQGKELPVGKTYKNYLKNILSVPGVS